MRVDELTIGERIRFQRLRRGLSQWDLGRKVGVPSYRLSEIERGVVHPDSKELRRITRALDIDIEDVQKAEAEVS